MDKQIIKNLTTNILAMALSLLINFLVIPFVTNNLGMEAYSYVGIITNIISFMTVITYTLNSMVGRFYTVELKQGNMQNSNEYISSAFYTCMIMGMLLVPIILLLTINLDQFILIESNLVNDVKIAFFISCITFIVSTFSSIMSTGSYSNNRLDISNMINIISNLIRIVVILILFNYFSARIWFVSISAFVQGVILLIGGYITFKWIVPYRRFSLKYFKKECVINLLSAGMFNSIIILGTTLMTQVDLLVGNRFIDAKTMGEYAIILLFANTLRNFASTLSSAFSPKTLAIYSENNLEKLRDYVNQVVSICGFIIGWPVAIMSCMMIPFIEIWLQNDFSSYRLLAVVMILPLGVNLSVNQLNVVHQAINKLKLPALASVISGIINIVLAIIFVKVYDGGIWGIVIASIISLSLRNIVFSPIYTSIIMNQKIHVYYVGIIKPFIISLVISGIGLVIQNFIVIDTLMEFILVFIILTSIYLILILSIFSKDLKKGLLKYRVKNYNMLRDIKIKFK